MEMSSSGLVDLCAHGPLYQSSISSGSSRGSSSSTSSSSSSNSSGSSGGGSGSDSVNASGRSRRVDSSGEPVTMDDMSPQMSPMPPAPRAPAMGLESQQ